LSWKGKTKAMSDARVGQTLTDRTMLTIREVLLPRRRRPGSIPLFAGPAVSQVVLSFALPVPMVVLVLSTRRSSIMGDFVNDRLVGAAAILGTVIILALNTVLLLQTPGVAIRFLPSSYSPARSGASNA
jgi:hypothetical protein